MINQIIKTARPSWLLLLLNPYLWLGICVWTAAVAGYAHQAGAESGRDAERGLWLNKEGARKDAEVTAVVKDSTARVQLQEKFNNTNVKVSTAHENENTARRRAAADDRAAADARGGLRIPAPATVRDCPAAATEAADAGGPDEEAAGTIRLPREIENDLWAAAEEADALSAQIRAMQEWLLLNGFYGTEPAEEQPLLDRMIADPNQTPEATHD